MTSSTSTFDVHPRAFVEAESAETLSVFFAKAMPTPGLISHTEEIAPGVLADYSDAEQLVSLDLNLASTHPDINVGGALACDYEPDSSRLTVFLTREHRTGRTVQQTDDAKIALVTDVQGLWHAVIIQDALAFVLREPAPVSVASSMSFENHQS